jgi:hypothetical protein
MGNSYIFVSDNKSFKTIAEAFNSIIFLLAMLVTASSYADVAKDLEDFKKSQLCGEDTCPEYISGEFTVCIHRAGSDCEKKFANEKKDKKDKVLLCTIEGGKKCKKTVDEALADSGGIEKIQGVKKLFSIAEDSLSKLEEEKKKIGNDPNMMKAQKEKQLKILEQKNEKFINEIAKIMQEQILNSSIELKGIYVYDFDESKQEVCNGGKYVGGGRDNCTDGKGIFWDADYIKVYTIAHSERKSHGWPGEHQRYHVGRYNKHPFKVQITVSENFTQKANRGIYDIRGIITAFSSGDGKSQQGKDEYGQQPMFLTIELKSSKYIGEKPAEVAAPAKGCGETASAEKAAENYIKATFNKDIGTMKKLASFELKGYLEKNEGEVKNAQIVLMNRIKKKKYSDKDIKEMINNTKASPAQCDYRPDGEPYAIVQVKSLVNFRVTLNEEKKGVWKVSTVQQ